MKSADFMPLPVLGVVAALGLSWLIDGELLDGGFGDWASAVPIANALTAEISASFLSIVGLLCESIEEAKPSVPWGSPPAGETTRKRQARSGCGTHKTALGSSQQRQDPESSHPTLT